MYNEFLEKTEYVDYDDPDVKILAEKLKSDAKDELSLIRRNLDLLNRQRVWLCLYKINSRNAIM